MNRICFQGTQRPLQQILMVAVLVCLPRRTQTGRAPHGPDDEHGDRTVTQGRAPDLATTPRFHCRAGLVHIGGTQRKVIQADIIQKLLYRVTIE